MAKQTYSIQGGSIAAVARVILGGVLIDEPIYLSAGKITFGLCHLPQAVKDAVEKHFNNVFGVDLAERNKIYDTQYRYQTTFTVITPAAKNIAGTLVDVKFPDGWKDGYIVSGSHRFDDGYRIDVVNTRFCKNVHDKRLYNLDPACVRKSPRAI